MKKLLISLILIKKKNKKNIFWKKNINNKLIWTPKHLMKTPKKIYLIEFKKKIKIKNFWIHKNHKYKKIKYLIIIRKIQILIDWVKAILIYKIVRIKLINIKSYNNNVFILLLIWMIKGIRIRKLSRKKSIPVKNFIFIIPYNKNIII